MQEKATWRTVSRNGLMVVGIGMLLATGGCAGEASKPAPTLTNDQVRGNADKAFDKLKQEEKNRAVDSGAGSY